ncbi:hypothetical protein Tco_1369132 [Tanacetum coccineum]
MIISITHYCCNMIIPEFNYTYEFSNKVDELRALPCYVLGATRVQIPEDNLFDLKCTREEDKEVETLDPQFLLGSELLENIDSTTLDFLLTFVTSLSFPVVLLLGGVLLIIVGKSGFLGDTTIVEEI